MKQNGADVRKALTILLDHFADTAKTMSDLNMNETSRVIEVTKGVTVIIDYNPEGYFNQMNLRFKGL